MGCGTRKRRVEEDTPFPCWAPHGWRSMNWFGVDAKGRLRGGVGKESRDRRGEVGRVRARSWCG